MSTCKYDESVFYKRYGVDVILLVVYVDNIVITGSDCVGISSVKSFLQDQFHTKDLEKICDGLAYGTGKLGSKPCNAPMAPNVQLTHDGKLFDSPERYRRLVGKLNYLRVTRPNITFAVSKVSQFMQNPIVHHWEALEHILCYLKGAPRRGILYSNHKHTRVECFSDSDWPGSKINRRSTTGYCVFVDGNLVSWNSKEQNVVSLSSAEVEYRAMARSMCEIMWIFHILKKIGIEASIPAKLWCDNQAALHIAMNPKFYERTKHIEANYHFVRDKVRDELITTGYMNSEDQLGDLFTKALMGIRMNYLWNKLGMITSMINIYDPA
ncbi:transmembrane signal receptor [Lithospermum erythrorhizon]|uniref:Transmembrane signal receptor n=1 Tax=Lithospermum erythrorhizon TaxID=34254 RepID=A0AAV3P9Y5_LITER